VESANRKLIRPSFTEIKEQLNSPRRNNQKKPVPPDQTNAENFYYVKQMQSKTPMFLCCETAKRCGASSSGTTRRA